MKTNLPQSQARLFGRAGESVTRSDRRQPELEFGSCLPPLIARPNRRRYDVFGWRVKASPLEGAPNEGETDGEILTPVGHPFISDKERRFAPATVRQDRNGVRHGLEQVSAFIGIRSMFPPDKTQRAEILLFVQKMMEPSVAVTSRRVLRGTALERLSGLWRLAACQSASDR